MGRTLIFSYECIQNEIFPNGKHKKILVSINFTKIVVILLIQRFSCERIRLITTSTISLHTAGCSMLSLVLFGRPVFGFTLGSCKWVFYLNDVWARTGLFHFILYNTCYVRFMKTIVFFFSFDASRTKDRALSRRYLTAF